MDDDMTVIDWIGKTHSKKTGFFMLSPVYGESSVQFAYGFLQLGLIIVQIVYACTIGIQDAKDAADDLQIPRKGLFVGIYVLPVFSALSFLEFVMARQLLKSEYLVELLSAHDKSERCRTGDIMQNLSFNFQSSSTHLQKALYARGVRWMRKQLDPSQTKRLVRLMIVLLNMIMPIIGLVFFLVVASFHKSCTFFFCTVMPLLAAWLFHLVADTAVFVTAQFCKYRIMVMRSDFDSIIESEEAEKGQFLNIIHDYIAMDELLLKMSGEISNLIFVSMAGMFLLFWFCVDVLLQALTKNVIICVVMIGCSAGILLLLIFLLYPLAQVTDLTIGRNSLGRSSSLIVSIHKCGMLSMTADVHGEYIRLLQLMLSCPIGIKIPLIGLLRTSDLAMYAKTLAAAVPTLVTTLVRLAQ